MIMKVIFLILISQEVSYQPLQKKIMKNISVIHQLIYNFFYLSFFVFYLFSFKLLEIDILSWEL